MSEMSDSCIACTTGKKIKHSCSRARGANTPKKSSETRSRSRSIKVPSNTLDESTKTVDENLNRKHDFFNLYALPVVISCWLWHMLTLFQMPPDADPITPFSFPRESNNSLAYRAVYRVFLAYLFIDTIWLVLYPRAVASPKIILGHHIIVLALWTSQVHWWSGYEFYVSSGLCLEVNTLFLIAKRQYRNVPLLHQLDSITWVIFRMIAFPLTYYNWMHATVYVMNQPNVSDVSKYFAGAWVVLGTALTTLQFYWSYQKFFGSTSNKSKKGL
jgi:hypothetical protein